MNTYFLTERGKQNFGWIRDNMETESAGYKVLDYLYMNGTGTPDAIKNHTRLPLDEVTESLELLKYEGILKEV